MTTLTTAFTYTLTSCYTGDLNCETFGPTTQTFTTSRGNVHEIDAYDWGPGTHGALLRKTLKTYKHESSTPYVTANIVDRVLTDIVFDGSSNKIAETIYAYDAGGLASFAAPQHDSSYGTGNTIRGNVSGVERWRSTDNSFLTTNYAFDTLGNIRTITDPNLNHTSFLYVDNLANTSCPPSSNSQAWVSTVTNALSQNIKVARFPCTGLVQAHQNQNDINASRAGTSYTYDLLGRLLIKSLPDGGQISNTYNDTPPVSVTSATKITFTTPVVTTAIMDGLGRKIQSQLVSDPVSTVFTDTTYDLDGRVGTVSNPYRSTSDPTYGITTTAFDALNRVTRVIPPGGTLFANNITTTYSGNCTTVADEVGNPRESCSDALGRITKVLEPLPSGVNPVLTYETDYQYDGLGNLTRVDQKGNDPNSADWRTRTFLYDSLSELLCASNPEQLITTCPVQYTASYTLGTTQYSYDNDGNLTSKVSPAPNQASPSTTVTLSYCYDALNRRTSKAYTQQSCPMTSPVSKYMYDQTSFNGLTITNGIGHRTGMTDIGGTGFEAWSYDSMGRVLQSQRTTNAVTKAFGYVYNYDGLVTSITYPGGDIVDYGYNSAAQLTSALNPAGGLGGYRYVSTAFYAPQGALSTMTNGAGAISTYYYNNRLQPCRISIKISGTSPTSCTDAINIGNTLDLTYNFSSFNGNNGNVFGISNNRDSTRSQSFTYDFLNRLTTAETTSTFSTSPSHCWYETYAYDPWANLVGISHTNSSYTNCTEESGLSATAEPNDQLSGYGYDAAGNTTSSPGLASFTYDAENHLITTAGVTYTYDGDGERVQKSNGKIYWYGMSSDPLSESDAFGNLTYEYVFFGDRRLVRRDSVGTLTYYFTDHLETSRVLTNGTGVILDDSDFYPYGGERAYSSGSGNTYKFTGKERDIESNLDNFGARYYSSSIARFLTLDPVIVSPERKLDPQQLNRYSYVRNSPLRMIDPSGEILQLSGDKSAGQANLCAIAGSACDRVTISDNGSVSINTQGLDLSKNEGATLINDLVQSQNTYDLSLGDSVGTAGGTIHVDQEVNLPPGTDQVSNRACNCASSTETPKSGVSDQVAINPNAHLRDSQGRDVPVSGLVFHELSEAFAKIDGGKPYGDYQTTSVVNGTTIKIDPPEQGAHNVAVQRELALRDQRPNLQSTGRAGDQLIRDPHK